MIKKKHIILALGVVSVLLGSLFVSNIILAQSGGEYDPWLDYNEDGTIDVNDLSPMGQAYGTSGEPVKSVIVTRYNWSLYSYIVVIPPLTDGTLNITTAGSKQITIGFGADSIPHGQLGNVSVATGFFIGGYYSHVHVDRFNVTLGWSMGPPYLPEYPVAKTYTVKGTLFTIAYYNPNDFAMELRMATYITG